MFSNFISMLQLVGPEFACHIQLKEIRRKLAAIKQPNDLTKLISVVEILKDHNWQQTFDAISEKNNEIGTVLRTALENAINKTLDEYVRERDITPDILQLAQAAFSGQLDDIKQLPALLDILCQFKEATPYATTEGNAFYEIHHPNFYEHLASPEYNKPKSPDYFFKHNPGYHIDIKRTEFDVIYLDRDGNKLAEYTKPLGAVLHDSTNPATELRLVELFETWGASVNPGLNTEFERFINQNSAAGPLTYMSAYQHVTELIQGEIKLQKEDRTLSVTLKQDEPNTLEITRYHAVYRLLDVKKDNKLVIAPGKTPLLEIKAEITISILGNNAIRQMMTCFLKDNTAEQVISNVFKKYTNQIGLYKEVLEILENTRSTQKLVALRNKLESPGQTQLKYDFELLLYHAACFDKADVIALYYTLSIDNPPSIRWPSHMVNNKITPLHLICANGHFEALKLLVSSNLRLELNPQDANGNTPWHYAAARGHANLFDFIINVHQFKKLEIKNSQGRTPLHLAAQNGYGEIVDLLSRIAPDLMKQADYKGMRPAQLAIQNGYNDLIAELGTSSFHRLCLTRGVSVEHIEMFLSLSQDQRCINQLTGYGETPLMLAARNGCHLFKFIFERDPDLIDKRDNQGHTALHHAFMAGNIDIIKFIIEKAPHILNTLDNNGNTALHHAVMMDDFTMVMLILERVPPEFNVFHKNKLGQSALDVAIAEGYNSCINQIYGHHVSMQGEGVKKPELLRLMRCAAPLVLNLTDSPLTRINLKEVAGSAYSYRNSVYKDTVREVSVEAQDGRNYWVAFRSYGFGILHSKQYGFKYMPLDRRIEAQLTALIVKERATGFNLDCIKNRVKNWFSPAGRPDSDVNMELELSWRSSHVVCHDTLSCTLTEKLTASCMTMQADFGGLLKGYTYKLDDGLPLFAMTFNHHIYFNENTDKVETNTTIHFEDNTFNRYFICALQPLRLDYGRMVEQSKDEVLACFGNANHQRLQFIFDKFNINKMNIFEYLTSNEIVHAIKGARQNYDEAAYQFFMVWYNVYRLIDEAASIVDRVRVENEPYDSREMILSLFLPELDYKITARAKFYVLLSTFENILLTGHSLNSILRKISQSIKGSAVQSSSRSNDLSLPTKLSEIVNWCSDSKYLLMDELFSQKLFYRLLTHSDGFALLVNFMKLDPVFRITIFENIEQDDVTLDLEKNHLKKWLIFLTQPEFDLDGNTPLHLAVIKCDFEMVKVLLESHAKVSIWNKNRERLIDIIRSFSELPDKSRITTILEKYDLIHNSYAFFNGIKHNDLTYIKAALSAGFDVNSVDQFGVSPLHYAVLYRCQNKNNLIPVLIARDAQVNKLAFSMCSPLLIALLKEDLDMMRFLVREAHADVNIKTNKIDPKGNEADNFIRHDDFYLLMQNQITLKAIDLGHIAVHFNKILAFEQLIDLGFDCSQHRYSDGDTLMHCAARKKRLEIMEVLNKKVPSFLYEKNDKGKMPLDLLPPRLKAYFMARLRPRTSNVSSIHAPEPRPSLFFSALNSVRDEIGRIMNRGYYQC